MFITFVRVKILCFCAYIQMLAGETSPPPLLTEADLIALMDKHGIGQWFTFFLLYSYVCVSLLSEFVEGTLRTLFFFNKIQINL